MCVVACDIVLVREPNALNSKCWPFSLLWAFMFREIISTVMST